MTARVEVSDETLDRIINAVLDMERSGNCDCCGEELSTNGGGGVDRHTRAKLRMEICGLLETR
jgi:hypothetical protein